VVVLTNVEVVDEEVDVLTHVEVDEEADAAVGSVGGGGRLPRSTLTPTSRPRLW